MNRYVIFAYSQYYPEGGWNDYYGSASTLQSAIELMVGSSFDYIHIVDVELKIVVWDNRDRGSDF